MRCIASGTPKLRHAKAKRPAKLQMLMEGLEGPVSFLRPSRVPQTSVGSGASHDLARSARGTNSQPPEIHRHRPPTTLCASYAQAAVNSKTNRQRDPPDTEHASVKDSVHDCVLALLHMYLQ